jgi:hypothetical protein
MEEQLTDVLNWLKVRADGAEKFVLEQAPLYVQEVVAWVFWGNFLASMLCFATILVSGYSAFRFLLWLGKDDNHEYAPLIMFWAVPLVVSVIGFFQTAPQALKAHVAPRVVIVEHLQKQVQKP